MVNNPKAREYGVGQALFSARAAEAPLPLSEANAPIATPQLLNDAFRSYLPGGTGLRFAHGLSPFSIICEGHKQAQQLKTLASKAALVESGASTSLADVTTLTSTDISFPTEAYVGRKALWLVRCRRRLPWPCSRHSRLSKDRSQRNPPLYAPPGSQNG